MITGSAGSIGSELARQIALLKPKILICVDWWENGLYDLELELIKKYPKGNFKFVIANIADKRRMDLLLKKYRIEILVHAAAYKHVPLMEENPIEVIKNNALATFELGKLAIKNKINKFLFLSTDKAIKPVSIMGASKLLAEHILKYLNTQKKTKFISVRFCNVFGSFGSVIPIWEKQILEGGPVTVTHKEATRWFMSIPEAVELILSALIIGEGGEIFILNKGKQFRIIDLAKKIIKESTLTSRKVKIKITGLRLGEKIKEESLFDFKMIKPTVKDGVFLIDNGYLDSKKLFSCLLKIKGYVKNEDEKNLFRELENTLVTYKHYEK